MDANLQESPQASRKTNSRTGILWNHLPTIVMCNTSTQIIKISHNEIMLEVPKTTPRFAYSLEKSTWSSYSCSHTCSLLQRKDQSKISREKMCVWQSPEETRHRLPKSFPCEVTRTRLTSPDPSSDNTRERHLPVPVSLDSVPVFLWRAGHTQASSPQHVPKFQIPRRKASHSH